MTLKCRIKELTDVQSEIDKVKLEDCKSESEEEDEF